MNHSLRKAQAPLYVTVVLLISLVPTFAAGSANAAVAQGNLSPLATSECFYPLADTTAWDYYGGNRDQNYGTTGSLGVASFGDTTRDRRNTFLRFDLSGIPDDAVILSADLELYLTGIDGTGGQTSTRLEAVEESWSETTLTWNYQPDYTDTKYDELIVTDSAGWKSWNAAFLANEWVTGRRTNHGVVIVSDGIASPPAHFYSREGSTPLSPRLCVEWQPYTDVLDPDSTGWRSGRNYTSSGFSTWFSQLSGQGYMMVDIEVDEISGTQRVGGVWQRNADGRGWYETRNMSEATFETYQQQRSDAGYRLIDQEVYVLGTSTYYAAIWIENVENLHWETYYDVTSSEFSAEFSKYSGMGYMPIDVDAYVIGGDLLYSAIWVDNVEDLEWHEWRNLTSTEFATKYAEYRDRFRMIDVESYLSGGNQYYAGIWVENENGRVWSEWRNMTSKEFGEKWLELRDAGYRLIDYEVYPTLGGWRYAGIWRQNSSRPDWTAKDDIDGILQKYFDDANLPGMSVAIAENGQFRYLRGWGDADVANGVATDSRTVYRLASVAKAVGGVLGLRLSEEGLLDLDADTRDYVPTMPVHHTHVFSETLSNRSGIGHYSDFPNWQQQVGGDDQKPDAFTTALDAAERLWDDALDYAPPGSTYRYSTPAYTFAGAAMEGAVGLPIGDIVEDYLQTPYGLTTLRVEDRGVPDPKRSLLYTGASDETTPDNISWKVLGGGLESSAYDLARMGILVNDGTVLTAASRGLLWTRPDSLRNYGLGWDLETHLSTQAVYKRGSQLGARGYIRIYPNEDIVFVILTNRRTGHDPIPLGRLIGKAILAPGSPRQALDAVEELIDEPDAEGLPAEYVIWPVSNPVAEPTVEDLQEPPGWQTELVYVPVIMR